MLPKDLFKTIFPALFLGLMSCSSIENDTKFDWAETEYDLALPLVNTKLTVGKISEESKGNSVLKIDSDGRVTVLFNGEIIRRTSSSIFPPFPGLVPVPIEDTLTNSQLPFKSEYLIKKAIFEDTKISFYFENDLPSDVKIKMKILGLQKNGQEFEQDYVLKYNNQLPASTTTQLVSIDGWTLTSQTNSLTFYYEAFLENGQKIKLTKAWMNFDLIKFSYLEGYLGYHIFPVDGNIIDISLFDRWLSGSFDFQNPKITISVDNAFGLPVRSRVNKMELTSITGNVVNLQSPFIDSGLEFAYPTFQELGQIKTTNFDFNKDNSNIREIFNEKTKKISYDISALINPEKDTMIKGFVTNRSYFVVNVAVEVPLHGSVNQLVITDTVEVDLEDFDDVLSAEFKSITSNDFPADLTIQGYFLDENDQQITSLFDNDGLFMEKAPLLPNGKTGIPIEKTTFQNFDETEIQSIKKAKKLAFIGKINTINSDQKVPLWIYNDYGLGMKLGVKLKYKKK